MATALIIDVETVIANGVRIWFFNDNSRIADMNAAEERFLVPILGQELYELLLTEVDEEASDYADLIAKCRRVLAPLAYWLDLPNIQSGITDRSAGTFTSQNMEPMHRWEYEKLLANLEDKGTFALDKLIEHLYEKKDDYSWTPPAKYTGIFTSGSQYNDYYTLYQPYRTFENLRAFVKHVEETYIRETIGDEFFEELRDNTNPSDEEIKALKFLRFAVANYTIRAAATKLPVRISADGFTTALSFQTDAVDPSQQMARAKELDILRSQAEQDGDAYLTMLKNYLDNNASETVFATYFASDKYTAPVAEADYVDPNTNRSGIMGF